VTTAARRQLLHRVIQALGALRRRPVPHALQQPIHGAVGGSGIIHGRPRCEHRCWRRRRAGAGAVDDDARGEATHERAVSCLQDSRVGDHKAVLELLPVRVLVGRRRVGVGVADEAEHGRRICDRGAVVVPDGGAAGAVAVAPDAQRGVPEVGGALRCRGVAAADSPDEGAVGAVAKGQGGEARGRRGRRERVQERDDVGPERAVGGRRGRRRRRLAVEPGPLAVRG